MSFRYYVCTNNIEHIAVLLITCPRCLVQPAERWTCIAVTHYYCHCQTRQQSVYRSEYLNNRSNHAIQIQMNHFCKYLLYPAIYLFILSTSHSTHHKSYRRRLSTSRQSIALVLTTNSNGIIIYRNKQQN